MHPVLQYFNERSIEEINSYTDANLAGDKKTRKSTSGGAMLIGNKWVKSWSKRQTLIATSSAEPELYASVKLTFESRGIMGFNKLVLSPIA